MAASASRSVSPSVSRSVSPSASLSPSASISPSPSIMIESVRRDPRIPIERVACRAYLSADQENITDSTWNKVNFNEVVYDLGTNFDHTTNYRFDVPVSGLYDISAVVNLVGASIVADKQYVVGIFIDATEEASISYHASLAGGLGLQIRDCLFLNKDSYVEIKVYPVGVGGNTVDIDGDASGTYCYVTIRLVTKEGIR